MNFAKIWVILKAESCWAALILYRIGNTTRYRACIAICIAEPYFFIVPKLDVKALDAAIIREPR